MESRPISVGCNITPMVVQNKTPRDGMKVESNDEEKMLKIYLNDMKKKINFLEKTNWMFKNNFDPQFLESLDPRIIDEQTNIFSIENNMGRKMRKMRLIRKL